MTEAVGTAGAIDSGHHAKMLFAQDDSRLQHDIEDDSHSIEVEELPLIAHDDDAIVVIVGYSH